MKSLRPLLPFWIVLLGCSPIQKESHVLVEEDCLEDELILGPPVVYEAPASEPTSEPTSEPAPSLRRGPTREDTELRLVFFVEKSPLVSLLAVDEYKNAGQTWARGKAAILSRGDPAVVRRAVVKDALPAATRAWLGQEVKLYKEDGSSCEASVTDLALVGRIFLWEETREKKPSAEEIWKLSLENGGVSLVAELDDQECEGARFARLASLPAPSMGRLEKAPKELRAQALRALRSLPSYKKTQKDYLAYLKENAQEGPKRWEQDAGASRDVLLAHMPAADLVIATLTAGEGCGYFDGHLLVVWELQEDGSTLRLLYQGPDDIHPDVALDIDGDGTWELLQGQSWFRLADGAYENAGAIRKVSEYEECPC